jgi:hypothetical protein
MDGKSFFLIPTHNLRTCLFVTAVGFFAATGATKAETVIFGKEYVGFPAKEFEYGLVGYGVPGRWEVVRDHTAFRGKALTQLTIDPTEDRFLVAIYNPVIAANVQITTRCKPVSGKVAQNCGLVVRAVDERNYYVARASALKNDVGFYRVRNGERQQLATAQGVKVASGEWHTLRVRVEGDRFTVTFNEKQLHTTVDRSSPPRPNEGHVGFWTKSDSVTRFDHLDIEVLP